MIVIHRAAFKGRLECLKIMLDALPSSHTVKDGEGRTPLHVAALGGFDACVSELVERGADMRMLDMNGYVPRDLAILKGHTETTALLYRLESNQWRLLSASSGSSPELEQCQMENKKIQRQLELVQSELETTQQQYSAQIRQGEKLQEMLQECQEKHANTVNSLTSDLEQAKDEGAELRRRWESAKGLVREAEENTMNVWEAKMEDAQKTWSDEKQGMEKRLEQLEGDLERANQRTSQMEEQLSVQATQNDSSAVEAKNSNETAPSSCEACESRQLLLDEAESVKQQLQMLVDQKEKELKDASADMEGHLSSHMELKHAYEQLKETVAELQAQCALFKDKSDQLEVDRQTEGDSRKAEAEAWNKEKDRLAALLQSVCSSLQTEAEKLQAQS